MAQKAKLDEEKGQPFALKSFFDQLNSIGGIPIALGTWEMTGIKPAFLNEVERLAKTPLLLIFPRLQCGQGVNANAVSCITSSL